MGGCISPNRSTNIDVDMDVNDEAKLSYVTIPETDVKVKIIGYDPEFSFVQEDHNLQNVMPLFEKCRVLGQGASCEVTHVRRRADNKEFAMKIMKRDDKWNPILFKQEYHLLTNLDHPNIVSYRDCYMDRKNFYLLSELCKGGELFDKIKQQRKFSEEMAAKIMKTIISAIAHCHDKDIVHRDLKPENIVFRTEAQEHLIIIDFGDAKVIKEDAMYEDFVGTAFYLAPECVRNRTGAELKKSDMWTIGVIGYVLLNGRPPFFGRDNKDILRKIIRAKVVFPKNNKLSNCCKDFLCRLIRKDTDKRLSARQALQHNWLKGDAAKSDLGKELIETLSNYSSVSRLKKVLVRMLGNQMTESDHKALRNQFNAMDKNGDGKVNLEELTEYIFKRGGTKDEAHEQASNIIKQVDQDNDGQISLKEWQDARLSTKFQDERLIKDSFKRIDTDDDGFITHGELSKLFNGQISQELVMHMIQEIDQNQDGKISYEEFVVAMKKGNITKVLSPRDHVAKQMTEKFRKELIQEAAMEEKSAINEK